MKLIYLFVFILAGCASDPSSLEQNNLPVDAYEKIVSSQSTLQKPLGGNYVTGSQLLLNADPKKDAALAYKSEGFVMMLMQSSIVPVGITDQNLAKRLLVSKKVKMISIPATQDFTPAGGKLYIDAAVDYADHFNKKILQLVKTTKR